MKSGLDFFPLDVNLDTKFELIEAEFGLQGFAVIVKLFQRIYGEQGYYCEWTNDVELLFAKRINAGGSFVSEIVKAALKRGIFDKDVYEKYSVLTSKGIQKRYFEAASRRQKVTVKNEYLLVELSDIPQNVNISNENVNISSENVNISSQSKVKKSKVKDSKVTIPPELSAVWDEFKKFRVRVKKPMTEYAESLMLKKLQGMSDNIETQKAILNQSIEKGWQDIYPLKGSAATQPERKSSMDMEEINRRAEALPSWEDYKRRKDN